MAGLKPKLQLSNGYDLDLVQTARLMQWLQANGDFDHSAAGGALGLSAIQVKNTASLATAAGLTLPRSGRLTALGSVLCAQDQYLTSPQTPWVVHFNLSASPGHLVWHRMTNSVIRGGIRLTVESAQAAFGDLYSSHTAYSASAHVRKELRVFFHAYTAGGPLSRLAYLEEQDGEYVAPSLLRVPPPAFGYSLLTFAARYREGETAISVGDIASAPSSPGRIFLMREPDVRAHLERMHRDGTISIESKGHLDQVRFAAPPGAADYLRAHFEDTED